MPPQRPSAKAEKPMAYHSQRVMVLSKCYVVEGRRVGKGQFAEVFRARQTNPTDGSDGLVALKVERDDATLMHEYKVLKVTARRGIDLRYAEHASIVSCDGKRSTPAIVAHRSCVARACTLSPASRRVNPKIAEVVTG
jgi:hypothetical protein